MGTLGGAKTGKSTFQSMEHVSGKSALKYVTDVAQTYYLKSREMDERVKMQDKFIRCLHKSFL